MREMHKVISSSEEGGPIKDRVIRTFSVPNIIFNSFCYWKLKNGFYSSRFQKPTLKEKDCFKQIGDSKWGAGFHAFMDFRHMFS